jgi:hypothetical protein
MHEFDEYLPLIQPKSNNLPVSKRYSCLEEYDREKRKRLALRKSVMDYSIGIIIVLTGIFFHGSE